jgi:hypothetical protein
VEANGIRYQLFRELTVHQLNSIDGYSSYRGAKSNPASFQIATRNISDPTSPLRTIWQGVLKYRDPKLSHAEMRRLTAESSLGPAAALRDAAIPGATYAYF